MKKILITGSLGYLGSVFTEYFAEHGYDVVGFDTGFFRDSILFPPKAVETIMRDARDMTEKDLEGVYAVVHLAGISNDPFSNLDAAKIYDPTRAYARTIATMCKKLGVKFVFASSCSVYGKGGDEALSEESPTAPQTAYAMNKFQIEQDLRELADKDFSPVALRFATAFGLSPRMRFDIVINMFVGMAITTKKIVLNSDGSAWRPNIHVLDMAQAARCAVESDWKGGLLIVNAGDEKNNMKIIDIARMVTGRIPGSEVKLLTEDASAEALLKNPTIANAKDTRTYQVSFEKIKKIFPGYSAQWPIEKGIEQMTEKFSEMHLSEEQFKDPKFYRLKTIADLYSRHYLSDDLRWLKPYP